MRIGTGYDVHKLVEGRALILGGVTIPYERGLDGHSDADVIVHAIMMHCSVQPPSVISGSTSRIRIRAIRALIPYSCFMRSASSSPLMATASRTSTLLSSRSVRS